MSRPCFSIITVCYNAEREIEHTLRSVAQQSYSQIEYLVVDGESKDHTLEIVGKYRSSVSQLVSEPDNGLYDAMNKGMALATGDYLIFLNAGDTFYANDTLQKIADSIAMGEQPDIIYGETMLVNHDRQELGMRRLSTPEKLTWRSFAMGMRVCHQAFIAKRTIASAYDLMYRFSADFDWCIRCMKQADSIFNTHQTLVCYLNEGMTTRNHKASLRERYAIMCRYYGTLPTIMRHIWFAVRFKVAKWRGKV